MCDQFQQTCRQARQDETMGSCIDFLRDKQICPENGLILSRNEAENSARSCLNQHCIIATSYSRHLRSDMPDST